MKQESTTLTLSFLRLWRRSIVAITAALVLVAISYEWIDRPVALFVHQRQWAAIRVFKWLTEPPPIAQTWSPLVLALLAARRARGPLAPWQRTLLAGCLSLIVADEFRTSLGEMCGRYWPETWHNDNPSLIGTGAYGFHPFARGDDIGSFPSGHAARIAGFFGVWAIAYPRSRWPLMAVSLPMLASLIFMNYHFVSDVVAGCVLGGVVARFFAEMARRFNAVPSPPTPGSSN